MKTPSQMVALSAQVVALSITFAFALPLAEARHLSPDQQAQIKSAGYPDSFTIVFNSKDINPATHKWQPVKPPLTLENWFYITPALRVTFHNGHNIGTTPLQKPELALLTSSPLKPTDFNTTQTPTRIRTKFGAPDQSESMHLGKHRYQIYRYLTPTRGIKSFTFLNGTLQAVSAGSTLAPDRLRTN